MAKKRILLVSYGGGHATMLAPVARELLRTGVDVRILALTMARKVFDKERLPYLTFNNFLVDSDGPALKRGEEIARTMHADHTGIPREESVAYLGLSYQDLVIRLGEPEAERRFAKQGRMAFEPVTVLERIFDLLHPDVVVTTNSPRAEQAARLVAAARGVPTVAVTDLLGTHVRPMRVDHLCLACRVAEQNYRKNPDVQSGAYHVVGNPAMDAALDFRGPPDPAWRQAQFPTDLPDPKYVVSAEQYSYIRAADDVFVQWTPDDVRRNLNRIHESCREVGAVLLVRPHPSLPPEVYWDWTRAQRPGTVFMAGSAELYPLLRSSDLVLSNNSTVMLDSLYLGRPVLLVRYPRSTTLLPFDEMGFAFSGPLEDGAAFTTALSSALRDEEEIHSKAGRFRAEFPDLPCAPRVAEVVRSCL